MQLLSTRLPIIILQTDWRTVSWMERNHAECCVQTRIISSYYEDFYGWKNKMFSRNRMLPFIFCVLRFYGWFLISVGLNVLCRFSSISMIISSTLIMIGHVREIRHVYWYAVPTSEDFFECRHYINSVGDVDWVSLAPDRKVWKAPLHMVMSLQVVQEAGKCEANGATVTGILGKRKISVNFKVSA